MFSNSFAGIAPSSAPAFIAAQVIGGAVAIGVIRACIPGVTAAAATYIIVPDHRERQGGEAPASPDRQVSADGRHQAADRRPE